MLSINFSRIKTSSNPLTHIENDVEVRDEFLSRSKKLLYQAHNIHVSGDLFYDEPFITGNFKVTADLVVPSSRSLQPVDYHQEFSFTENYSQNPPTKEQLEDIMDPIVLIKNDIIDLQTAVEDNILINIPTTILTEEEKSEDQYPSGNDWKVVSENDFEKEKKPNVNPAFAKLKGLFDQKNDNSSDE